MKYWYIYIIWNYVFLPSTLLFCLVKIMQLKIQEKITQNDEASFMNILKHDYFHNFHFLNIWHTNLNFLFVHLNLKAATCLISSFLFRIILILTDILKEQGRLITMFAGIQFIFIEFWWSRHKNKKLCRQALRRDTAFCLFFIDVFYYLFTVELFWEQWQLQSSEKE